MVYLQNSKIKNYKIAKKHKAVTLIELLAVIAIIGIMTAVTIVSMNSGKTQAKLKAAQSEVASSIKLAQSYALQGREQAGVTPRYYGIKFTDDKTFVLCGGNATCDDSVEIYQLKDGVILTNDPLPAISFNVPHGNSNLPADLTLTFMLNSGSKSITISKSGSITEN